MLKRLRRWHFDLALFLGLAIFSWAYWYSKPRPVWTSYYSLKENGSRNNNFTILGYSADSQSIYTSVDTTVVSKNCPIPQIQRWSTRSGELLEDYPVELPEEDRFLLNLPRQRLGLSLTVTLCADPRYFTVRYHQSSKKDHHYVRLYRIDGKPLGQGLEVYQYDRVEYLTDPSGGDRHWITQFELNSRKSGVPISVIDLDTGKPVRAPRVYAEGKQDAFPVVHQGRTLVFRLKASETTPMQFEIIDLHTGESRGFIPKNRYDGLEILDNTHYVLKAMIGCIDSYTNQLHFYQYDPDSRTIKPDHTPPLDGLTSAMRDWPSVIPPYLVIENHNTSSVQQQHQIMQTLLGWLARIGIVRNNTNTSDYRILDMITCQPLRQVTCLPQDVGHAPSPDWCSIAALISFNDKSEPGLCLYLIPHYLWEPTLSWMQWLAWLLVIPWPLRYFLPTHLAPGSSSRGSTSPK
ncbi:MAG TPA: hypothetical protein PLN21_00455 [Gemmatales bacterium]|nr:hypothetical protein [Gemmatales bacterium]